MGIANPDAALEHLREFRELLILDERALREGETQAAYVQRIKLQPLIEEIANELDPDGSEDLGGRFNTLMQRWTLNDAIKKTHRLTGILETREESQRIFGPVGPTLVGSQLHSWVWEAAADLWDGGHYEPAVHQAWLAVELQTQQKVGRFDLTGTGLYNQAFSLDDPKADASRLRFPHLDKTTQEKSWRSAHQGAMNLGKGCAQGIRNRQAHPSDAISEQEALEQLAALSVLARWVDECKAVSADDDAAGE